MLFHAKEFTLEIRGSRMDCISFGTGGKPLVMIQGLNTRGIRGSVPMLAWMYRLFAREYTVYLFDRRQDLPETVTVRELAADTAAAMDALHLTQAHILGVSLGGMMAQYLAIDRPDLVQRMVLAVTPARSSDTLTEVIGGWLHMTEQSDWKGLVADMAGRMYSDAYLRRYRPFLPLLTAVQKPKDPRRFMTLARACLTCHADEERENISCPVLVIGGGEDRIVGSGAAAELAETLNCPLHLYPHLGHAAYEEAKDFNRIVFAFFTGSTLDGTVAK